MFIHWLYPTTVTTPRITLGDSVNNMVRHYARRGGARAIIVIYRYIGGRGKMRGGFHRDLERRHGGNKMEGLSGPIYIRGTR